MVLTKQEFAAKHKAKFVGLTRATVDLRYADYLAQQQPASAAPARRDRVARVARSTPRDRPRAASAQTVRVAEGGKMKMYREMPHAELTSAFIRALLNPFDLAARGEAPPQVPDGEHLASTTAMFEFNANLFSTTSGRVALVFKASPWANHALSSVTSDVVPTPNGYAGNLEYNAYNAYAERASDDVTCPTWTADAWSIPAPGVSQAIGYAGFGMQDVPEAVVLYTNAAAWRPVCAGLELKYTAAALEASGQIVAAPLTGVVGLPAQCNDAYSLGESIFVIHNPFGTSGSGPTFDTVQTLRKAQVYKATEGIRQVWLPDAMAGQAHWRSVKPRAIAGSANSSQIGAEQLSNFAATGAILLPPPVTGDTARMEAMADRLYTENGWVAAPTGAGVTGQNSNLYFDSMSGFATNPADDNTFMAFEKQSMLFNCHQFDMHTADSAIIWVGEGFEPSTLVGTVRFVLGVEYIPDSRTLTLGRRDTKVVPAPRSVQLDAHAASIAVASSIAPSASGESKATTFIEDAVSMATTGLTIGKAVVDGVSEIAAILGPIIAAF